MGPLFHCVCVPVCLCVCVTVIGLPCIEEFAGLYEACHNVNVCTRDSVWGIVPPFVWSFGRGLALY